MPNPSALVSITARVWGNMFLSASNTFRFSLTNGLGRSSSIMRMASAAAVDSSSRELFARLYPVRLHTIVWKLNKASSRPCEISDW